MSSTKTASATTSGSRPRPRPIGAATEVYVLNYEYFMDHSAVLGVFTTLAGAQAHPHTNGPQGAWKHVDGEWTASLQRGNAQLRIELMKVNP